MITSLPPVIQTTPKTATAAKNGKSVKTVANAVASGSIQETSAGLTPVEIASILNLPSSPPSFTTPTLDFASHSAELEFITDVAAAYAASYFATHHQISLSILDELAIGSATSDSMQSQQTQRASQQFQAALKQRDNRVRDLVSAALDRLQVLTSPPHASRRRSHGTLAIQHPSKFKPLPQFDPTLPAKNRARYHLLRGRLLALLPHLESSKPADGQEETPTNQKMWDPSKAQADLGACVKLDPSCAEGWNTSGEWFWMEASGGPGSPNGRRLAKVCFERSIHANRNAEGLLKLAQVIREPSSLTPHEIGENLKESIKLCKEALKMDTSNGRARLGLASSFLKVFFAVTFEIKDLLRSLSLYHKAEECDKMTLEPDLYRNRAVINHYLERYQEAMEDFTRAAVIDPKEIGLDSRKQVIAMKNFLKTIQNTITGLKNEWKAFTDAIHASFASFTEISGINDLLFDGAHETLPNNQDAENEELPLIPIASSILTAQEANAGKIVRLRILKEIENQLPRMFVVVDKQGTVFALSLFNAISGIVTAGDELVVCDPSVRQVAVSFEDCEAQFTLLRVDQPWKLTVNGKLVAKQNVACTQARFESL